MSKIAARAPVQWAYRYHHALRGKILSYCMLSSRQAGELETLLKLPGARLTCEFSSTYCNKDYDDTP
jgi:hypothetical protein